jgi:hypothetical protein
MQMLVSWTPHTAPRCTDHGELATQPLEHHDAGIRALEHLRDVHGRDAEALNAAIVKVRRHKKSRA